MKNILLVIVCLSFSKIYAQTIDVTIKYEHKKTIFNMNSSEIQKQLYFYYSINQGVDSTAFQKNFKGYKISGTTISASLSNSNVLRKKIGFKVTNISNDTITILGPKFFIGKNVYYKNIVLTKNDIDLIRKGAFYYKKINTKFSTTKEQLKRSKVTAKNNKIVFQINDTILKKEDEIKNFQQIKTLSLSGEKINEVPKIILEMQTLKELWLNDCSLIKIPTKISNLKELEILFVSNNLLTKLPTSLEKLTNLIKISAYHNKIETLPDELGYLVNLKTLNLSSNKIKSIPNSFSNLINLEFLSLSENKFTEVPKQLFALKNIRSIDLNDNEITEVEILNVSNVKHLNLSNNKITTIKGVSKLQNLMSLSLSDNNIKKLSKEIYKLKNITFLNVKNNKISKSDIKKLQKKLPNCEILY